MTGFDGLEAEGFALRAVVDVEELPDWVIGPIRTAGLDPTRFQRLVMLGQAGPGLWDTLRRAGFVGDDRFDDYSRHVVGRVAAAHGGAAHEILYPGEIDMPLGRMAGLVGWGDASPLGLTINDRYGLWLAHRVVFLIDAPLAPHRRATGNPCLTCEETPCVSACPVGAVSVESGFDVDACSRFRIAADSPCADRCLARLACPVGTEFTYGPEQMAYHYEAGLRSIKQWYGGADRR